VELAVFLAPFGIVQYMPNLFYGALLALFGIEITLDWLFHSYRKARAPREPRRRPWQPRAVERPRAKATTPGLQKVLFSSLPFHAMSDRRACSPSPFSVFISISLSVMVSNMTSLFNML